MNYLEILVLALVQGATELLPVSSSAHVILTEKLMGLDPTAPEMTFLLVMLHTGTMFAVIAYFWRSWRDRYFSTGDRFWSFAKLAVAATALTGVVGLALMLFIEHVVLRGSAHDEIETLFGNSYIIASGLAAVGVMIVISGKRKSGNKAIGYRDSVWIGAVQGLCLPFRGFSRSGATISTGLFRGCGKEQVEDFSFALAVVLTPPVIAREGYRLFKAQAHSGHVVHFFTLVGPSLFGMLGSFVAGLLALRWLSRWIEHNRWHLFGYYCFFAAAAVLVAQWIWH
ncbi:MAG: undecaprenyl-diphosphate phosphatase [Acidiferrobacterales bacterium]